MNESKVRCKARSKRTGEQCGQFCAPGFEVCRWHGARAPQVRKAAEARALLLSAKVSGEELAAGSSPFQSLVNAASQSDRILRTLLRQTDAQGHLTSEALSALGEWADRVARLARSVIDSRAMEREEAMSTRTGNAWARVIRLALEDLELSEVQAQRADAAVRSAIARVFGPVLERERRELERG